MKSVQSDVAPVELVGRLGASSSALAGKVLAFVARTIQTVAGFHVGCLVCALDAGASDIVIFVGEITVTLSIHGENAVSRRLSLLHWSMVRSFFL